MTSWAQLRAARLNWQAVLDALATWQAVLNDPGSPQQIDLEITADPIEGGVQLIALAPYTYTHVTVSRFYAGAWQVVRGADEVALSAGTWTGIDYEAPLGVPITYRATFLIISTGEDDYVEVTITLTDPTPGKGWLGDVVDPASAMLVWVEGIDAIDRPTEVGVYEIIGRTLPVVVTGNRGSRRGVLRLFTETLDERDQMWALLDEGDILLFRTSPEYGVGNLYMAVEAVTEQRITRVGFTPVRRFTLEFIETAPPVGSLVSSRTNSWATVLGGTESWQTLLDDRETWLTVLTIPYEAP